jgi:hypothetical protein
MCGINVFETSQERKLGLPNTQSRNAYTVQQQTAPYRHLVKTPHTCTSLTPSQAPPKGRPQAHYRSDT